MHTHSPAKDSASHTTQPFFASHVPPAASFFSNPAAAEFVQRKCDACDAERPLQPQLQAGPVDDPLEIAADAMADRAVQRQAVDAGGFDADALQAKSDRSIRRECASGYSGRSIQPQLEVGPVDDPLEIEADAMADRVVRRQAAGTGGIVADAPPLQAKADQVVQRQCASCQSDRRILPQLEIGPVDDPLEVEADAMADHVVRRQAADRNDEGSPDRRAWAKTGSTDSSASAGDGLESALAHSSGSGAPLASPTRDRMEDAFGADFSAVRIHTGSASSAMNEEIGARAFTYGTDIHFNDGEYQPGTQRGAHLLAHELTHVVQQNSGVQRAPKRLQRKLLVFGPTTGIPSGTLIHNYGVLPQFVQAGLNPGVWTEPGIPGANKDVVGLGLKGEPDFYRDNGVNGVPIGINQRKVGGFQNMNVAAAAPKKPLSPGGSVQDLGNAPSDIELGDLKPGHSPEEQLGRLQIRNYIKGIENTANAVNSYQQLHGHADRWSPAPKARPMVDLTVPDNLTRSSSAGTRYSKLDVWEWTGKATRHSFTSLKGSLIVYRSSVPGIWAYEWMPESVPDSLGEDFDVQRLLDRLNHDVRPRLEASQQVSPKFKASKSARRKQRTVLRRKAKPHKKFDEKGWLGAYTPWRKDADKALGDTKSKNNEAVLEAVTEGKKRTGFDPKLPQAVKDRAKAFAQVRHWMKFGRIYGWLRKTFDRVYVKLAGFAKWIKEKVRGLVKSASSSGFGNWIKAAAMALFKVAKKLGAWAISMILDKLLDSLQEGVINVLGQLAEAVTPESVKSKIEEVEALKARYEEMLQEAEQSLEKKLFGDKLELFSQLAKYMEIANTVSTIVSVVKWGIRIIACASPPLLGCLWNLAIAALEWAFSKLMETCWFGAKVMGWVRDSGIQAILDFPAQVAQFIAGAANNLMKKVLPEGIGPLFADIKIDHREFRMKCEGGGGGDEESDSGGSGEEPTEEQKALMDLAQEVGDEKMEAFLEMAAKRAVDYNVQLDAERIRQLGSLIKSLTVEQMKAIAQKEMPKEGIPVSAEEFLKSIATLKPEESKRKEERKIDYDKAQRSNRQYERSEIGWKPELFVKSGAASDSREFAEAIYDIQKLLGLKPDGMAGAKTTKSYYEANRLAKDAAYANAAEQVQQAEQQVADEKERAELEKENAAIQKEPAVKAAMARALPSNEQLKKDLAALDWTQVPDGGIRFFTFKDGGLVAIKTDAGGRIGAAFHYAEREFRGTKAPMIVKTTQFYALDDIPHTAIRSWLTPRDGKEVQVISFLEEKKDTFFYPVVELVNKFVRLQ